MKVVLITGASGALGHAIVLYFKKNTKYKVVATNRRGNPQNYVELDIRNSEQLANVVRNTKPDLVIHLAATFVNEFKQAYAVNVEATRQLLEIVHQSQICTRIVLIGSAAEYGMVRPEENPVCEDRILKPVSIYGLTKAWQTTLAGVYASRGVDVVVARAFNLFGPGISERLFVGRLKKKIDEVLNGQKSVIEIGPLKSIRDYISTDEAAAQIFAIATKGDPGGVYHVASGKPVTIKDMLNRYLSIHGIDATIVRESENMTNRIGYDVPEIYADIDKTLKLIRSCKE